MPIQFGGKQFLATQKSLNARKAFTVEAVCEPTGTGSDPTIFAKPAGAKWESPFVIYRLGFQGDSLVPEFQVLMAGNRLPTTVVAPAQVLLNQKCHLSGTFDGIAVRLYVDGREVAAAHAKGPVAGGTEPDVIGARSSTAPGGFLVGLLYEVRLFGCARSTPEIVDWCLKPLPAPGGEFCEGLWKAWTPEDVGGAHR